jgi:hypothetical protein
MILNLANAMDIMTNEDPFKAFTQCKKLELEPELNVNKEFCLARTKVFELHTMKSKGQMNRFA